MVDEFQDPEHSGPPGEPEAAAEPTSRRLGIPALLAGGAALVALCLAAVWWGGLLIMALASAGDSVIYAAYFKPDGQPFTRYVNRSDPRVKALIGKGSGRTPLDRLLSAAEQDASVERVSREIRFESL